MPKVKYRFKKLAKDRLQLLAVIAKIVESYASRGYDLTLRQLYYVCIARDLLPEPWIDEAYNRKHGLAPDTKNTVKNYKRLGGLLDDGRMLGLIDWDTIVDRTRSMKNRSAWDSPSEVIDSAYSGYHRSRWENQTNWPCVFVEKEALAGVFEQVCHRYDLPLFACRGYTSQSSHWRIAQYLIGKADHGYHPVILHFGDHDPSGIDMTRDIEERFSTFNCFVEVRRIALNMDQVEQYDPPPNPAKATDARFAGYLDKFGEESWELDALTPEVLTDLVREQVNDLRVIEDWKDTVEQEQDERARLRVLMLRWEQISEHLDGEYEHELAEAREYLKGRSSYQEELAE